MGDAGEEGGGEVAWQPPATKPCEPERASGHGMHRWQRAGSPQPFIRLTLSIRLAEAAQAQACLFTDENEASRLCREGKSEFVLCLHRAAPPHPPALLPKRG